MVSTTLQRHTKACFIKGLHLKVLQPTAKRFHLSLEPVLHVFAVICHPIYASVDVFQSLLCGS